MQKLALSETIELKKVLITSSSAVLEDVGIAGNKRLPPADPRTRR